MIELNKIYNEDCLETMCKIDDNFIDLTITSLPSIVESPTTQTTTPHFTPI